MQLLVELVQQCCQDLECLFHDRESAVLIVTMVDTAVTISTDLGRTDWGSGEKGGDWRGRGKRKWRREKRQREMNSRLHLSHGYNMTHLYIKPCLLEIFHQWKTASNWVWFALTHHLLCSFIKLLEGIWVQVAGYTLVCVCVGWVGEVYACVFTVALAQHKNNYEYTCTQLINDANTL